MELLEEMSQYTNVKIPVNKENINIIDGYVGLGYALSQKEEIDFIQSLAKLEGIVLDPVYTGKAMYGLVEEIKKEILRNIIIFYLFIQEDYLDGVVSK